MNIVHAGVVAAWGFIWLAAGCATQEQVEQTAKNLDKAVEKNLQSRIDAAQARHVEDTRGMQQKVDAATDEVQRIKGTYLSRNDALGRIKSARDELETLIQNEALSRQGQIDELRREISSAREASSQQTNARFLELQEKIDRILTSLQRCLDLNGKSSETTDTHLIVEMLSGILAAEREEALHRAEHLADFLQRLDKLSSETSRTPREASGEKVADPQGKGKAEAR